MASSQSGSMASSIVIVPTLNDGFQIRLGKSSGRLTLEYSGADLCLTVRGHMVAQQQLARFDQLLAAARANLRHAVVASGAYEVADRTEE